MLLRRIHQERPGDLAWGYVAIGDLVALLVDLDRGEETRQALIDHARRDPDPAHRDEFARIWKSLELGHKMECAAESIFTS